MDGRFAPTLSVQVGGREEVGRKEGQVDGAGAAVHPLPA